MIWIYRIKSDGSKSLVKTKNFHDPFSLATLVWGELNNFFNSVLIEYLYFSNPLVPCDAITIPKVDLYHWKEEAYHGGVHHAGAPIHHTATVHHAAPVHAAPVHTVHHAAAAPVFHQPSAALHYAPSNGVYSPTPEPRYAPTPAPQYAPTPAPYTPTVHAPQSPYTTSYTSPYAPGGFGTNIKSFVHTPLHSFHGTVGKK